MQERTCRWIGHAPREALGDEEAIEKSDKLDLQKQQADALVHMARGFLSGSQETSTADHYQVMVHVDEQGNPLNVGRKHRMVQPALRRALVSATSAVGFRDAPMKTGSTRIT